MYVLSANLRHALAATMLAFLASSTGYTQATPSSSGNDLTPTYRNGTSITRNGNMFSATTPVPLPSYDPTKVANPSANVSAGTTPIGATPGSFAVSPSGAATYSIPLQVVPNPGGLQPSLSIDYTSAAGNGPLGVGFSLGGVSSITRCARTLADDGENKGVQLNSTDRFCLGGLKLVAVSGVYGADGTEYRTLPDTHVRVRSYGTPSDPMVGPSSFVVSLPNGTMHSYGNGSVNPDIIKTVLAPSGKIINVGWPLLVVRDSSGSNRVSYEYDKNVVAGHERERWLSRIVYGSGSQYGHRVSFSYQDRPDKSFGWMYGGRRESTKLLKTITIEAQTGFIPNHYMQRVRSYALEYIVHTNGSTRSKLASITECGSAYTECLRPTRFSWSYNGTGFQSGVKQTMPLPSSPDTTIVAADLNGDGRTDFAYPEATKWKYTLSHPYPNNNNHYAIAKDADNNPWGVKAKAYPFDYNLDGKTDLLPISPQTNKWRPVLSVGSNGGWRKIDTTFWGPLNQVGNGSAAFFGDFNGDGLQDTLEGRYYPNTTKWRWWMRLRTGKVSASIDNATAPIDSEAFVADANVPEITTGVPVAPDRMLVLDINGDGRDEIVWGLIGTASAYHPVANQTTVAYGLPQTIFDLDIKLADLNGDGLVDIITNGVNTTPGTTLYYRLNTGRGFTAEVPITGITVGTQALKATQVVDINGDNRFELLVPRLTSGASFEPTYIGMDLVQSSFNATGDLVFTRSNAPVITFPDGLTNSDLEAQGLRVVDADSDGDSDVVVFDRAYNTTSSSITLFKTNADGGDRLLRINEGNQMPTITGGVPASVAISYAPLTDTSVYTAGDCVRIQWMSCATGTPMTVVRKVERDSGTSGAGGTGAKIVSEYRYTAGRFDKRTQGFAGFAEVLVTSYGLKDGLISGLTHKRSFYTNIVAGNVPLLREEWTHAYLSGSREALGRTKTFWTKKTVGPTSFEYLSQTQSFQYEFPVLNCGTDECLMGMSPASFDALGKTPFTKVDVFTIDVDTYGNILSSRTAYGTDGMELTDRKVSYDIDTVNWLLRRPIRVETTDRTFDGQANRTDIRTTDYTYGTSASERELVKQEKSYASVAFPGKVLTVDYEYYSGGFVSRKIITDASTGQKRETTFAYDPYGHPHAVRNALGHTSYTAYDLLTGKLNIAVDANGLRTDYTYDSLGRIRKTTFPGKIEQHTSYSLQTIGNEQLVQVERSDATGARTQSIVDRGGRPLIERTKGFDGIMREATFQYDALGRLVATTAAKRTGSAEPVYTTTYAYDDLGRVIKQIEPGNVVRTTAYETLTTTHTNARGYKTQSTVNQRGQTISTTDGVGTPQATTRSYSYAPFGKPTQTAVVGVANSTSNMGYDSNGYLSWSVDAERGYKSYTYNAFGEMTNLSEGNGELPALETTLVYDVLGRLDSRTVKQNGAIRSVIDHTYDTVASRTTLGALLRSDFTDHVAGGHKHTTDTWFDALGRVQHTDSTMRSDVTPTANETFRVSHTYDTLGRPASLTFPLLNKQQQAARVVYDYAGAATSNGALLRVTSLEGASKSGVLETVLWQAEITDQQDRLTQWKAGDGVHTQQVIDWRGLTTATTVRTDDWDDQGDRTLAKMRFGYDNEGNVALRADDLQSATETFAYDPLNRLSASSTKTTDPFAQPDDRFTYDKLGNLVSSTRRGVYTFDASKPTQVVAVTGGTLGGATRMYGYDYWGNQVMRPDGKVVYNDFNLPARFTTRTDVPTASFLYDAAGQRVRKTTPSQTITTVPGLYERHRSTDGTVEHRLLVPTAGATLRYTERSGTLIRQPILYAHGDHLNSTTLLTQTEPDFDGVKAVVAEKRSYESFGLPRNPDWKATDAFGGVQRPLLLQGYTGHDEDRELGLVNMKGRMYDPKLGRFLTPDPFVDGSNPTQRWNRYAYVSNNPLRYTDPTGFRMSLQDRVQARLSQFAWATGTIEGDPNSDFNQMMSGHIGASEFQPVGTGSATSATDMWNWAMKSDWMDRRDIACYNGCSKQELDKIDREFAKDWNLSLPKNPVKEAKPQQNGSVSGNDSSGQSDGALDAEAPFDPLEEWATNGDTLDIGIDETDPYEEWATDGESLEVGIGEVATHHHTPKPAPDDPWADCSMPRGPGCQEPEPADDCLGPSCDASSDDYNHVNYGTPAHECAPPSCLPMPYNGPDTRPYTEADRMGAENWKRQQRMDDITRRYGGGQTVVDGTEGLLKHRTNPPMRGFGR